MKLIFKLLLISFVLVLCGINAGNVLAYDVKCPNVGPLLQLDKKNPINPSSGVKVGADKNRQITSWWSARILRVRA